MLQLAELYRFTEPVIFALKNENVTTVAPLPRRQQQQKHFLAFKQLADLKEKKTKLFHRKIYLTILFIEAVSHIMFRPEANMWELSTVRK